MVKISIGTDETNKFISEDINNIGNLFIYGGSGSGKSVWIRQTIQNVVTEIPQDLFRICYINPWGKHFLPVETKYLFNGKAVSDCLEDTNILFDEILTEIETREKTKNNLPKILIFCDDVDSKIFSLSKLEKILEKGVKNGVYTVISSQTVNWLSSEIIGYFKSKLFFWHYNTENIDKFGNVISELSNIKPFEYFYQKGNLAPIKCTPLEMNIKR